YRATPRPRSGLGLNELLGCRLVPPAYRHADILKVLIKEVWINVRILLDGDAEFSCFHERLCNRFRLKNSKPGCAQRINDVTCNVVGVRKREFPLGCA